MCMCIMFCMYVHVCVCWVWNDTISENKGFYIKSIVYMMLTSVNSMLLLHLIGSEQNRTYFYSEPKLPIFEDKSVIDDKGYKRHRRLDMSVTDNQVEEFAQLWLCAKICPVWLSAYHINSVEYIFGYINQWFHSSPPTHTEKLEFRITLYHNIFLQKTAIESNIFDRY